jgi:hypothetical protein
VGMPTEEQAYGSAQFLADCPMQYRVQYGPVWWCGRPARVTVRLPGSDGLVELVGSATAFLQPGFTEINVSGDVKAGASLDDKDRQRVLASISARLKQGLGSPAGHAFDSTSTPETGASVILAKQDGKGLFGMGGGDCPRGEASIVIDEAIKISDGPQWSVHGTAKAKVVRCYTTPGVRNPEWAEIKAQF